MVYDDSGESWNDSLVGEGLTYLGRPFFLMDPDDRDFSCVSPKFFS